MHPCHTEARCLEGPKRSETEANSQALPGAPGKDSGLEMHWKFYNVFFGNFAALEMLAATNRTKTADIQERSAQTW